MPAKQLVFHDAARDPIRRGVMALNPKRPSGGSPLASEREMPTL